MVICDAIVDGNEGTVIFWDPEAIESQLRPGVQLEVAMDGQNAAWKTHNQKTSFQIRPAAEVNFLSGTQPQASEPATTYQGKQPAQSEDVKSGEEILTRSADLVAHYAEELSTRGLPPEIVAEAAAHAPTIVSSWWFGQGGKWA